MLLQKQDANNFLLQKIQIEIKGQKNIPKFEWISRIAVQFIVNDTKTWIKKGNGSMDPEPSCNGTLDTKPRGR